MATNVTSLIKLRLQTKIKISSGKVGLKISPQLKKKKKEYCQSAVCGSETGEVEGKRTIRLNAKRQRSSSCDDGNSRKGPRVRDNRPFVLNFDTLPFFFGQETSIVARLEHIGNPEPSSLDSSSSSSWTSSWTSS